MAITVYVSAPYSADSNELIEANVRIAMDSAFKLMEAGFIVICPHLCHFYNKETWDFWMNQCLGLLALVDVVCVIGISKGVFKEIQQAMNMGIAINYSVEDTINNHSTEAIEKRRLAREKFVLDNTKTVTATIVRDFTRPVLELEE